MCSKKHPHKKDAFVCSIQNKKSWRRHYDVASFYRMTRTGFEPVLPP